MDLSKIAIASCSLTRATSFNAYTVMTEEEAAVPGRHWHGAKHYSYLQPLAHIERMLLRVAVELASRPGAVLMAGLEDGITETRVDSDVFLRHVNKMLG